MSWREWGKVREKTGGGQSKVGLRTGIMPDPSLHSLTHLIDFSEIHFARIHCTLIYSILPIKKTIDFCNILTEKTNYQIPENNSRPSLVFRIVVSKEN